MCSIDRFNIYLNRDRDGRVHGYKCEPATDGDGDWARGQDAQDLSDALDEVIDERDELYVENEKLRELLRKQTAKQEVRNEKRKATRLSKAGKDRPRGIT